MMIVLTVIYKNKRFRTRVQIHSDNPEMISRTQYGFIKDALEVKRRRSSFHVRDYFPDTFYGWTKGFSASIEPFLQLHNQNQIKGALCYLIKHPVPSSSPLVSYGMGLLYYQITQVRNVPFVHFVSSSV